MGYVCTRHPKTSPVAFHPLAAKILQPQSARQKHCWSLWCFSQGTGSYGTGEQNKHHLCSLIFCCSCCFCLARGLLWARPPFLLHFVEKKPSTNNKQCKLGNDIMQHQAESNSGLKNLCSYILRSAPARQFNKTGSASIIHPINALYYIQNK